MRHDFPQSFPGNIVESFVEVKIYVITPLEFKHLLGYSVDVVRGSSVSQTSDLGVINELMLNESF